MILFFRQEQQFLQTNEKKLGDLQNLQSQIHQLCQGQKPMIKEQKPTVQKPQVVSGGLQPEGWREGGLEGERLQQQVQPTGWTEPSMSTGWTQASPYELYRKEMSGGILLGQ
jgi:hypothetical protein